MLRLLLTRRWLLRTALAVAVAAVFVRLGLWQWDRAQSSTGRGTNWAYAVEWWIFAAFVFFCLWHWLRDSAEGPGDADGTPAAPDPLPHRARAAATTPATTPSTPAPVDDEDDPELAAYNAHLARLNARAQERR